MILPEYLQTVFIAELPLGGWPHLFHIITAWNPRVPLDDSTTRTLDESLRKLLNREGSRCFRIIGCSSDSKHQEPGWGVAGLSRSRAIEIAREYHQNAIFEVKEGHILVISCLTHEEQLVGSWGERVVGKKHGESSPT